MLNGESVAEGTINSKYEHELGLIRAAMAAMTSFNRPIQPSEVADAAGLSIEVVNWHLDVLTGKRRMKGLLEEARKSRRRDRRATRVFR